jgi:uncharacterized DUF497 family protein
MDYEWDERKRAVNLRKHGVDFAVIESFVWESAVSFQDTRKQHGETRYVAYGPISARLHCVVYTVRGRNIRIISLRKANRREVNRYGQETENHPAD